MKGSGNDETDVENPGNAFYHLFHLATHKTSVCDIIMMCDVWALSTTTVSELRRMKADRCHRKVRYDRKKKNDDYSDRLHNDNTLNSDDPLEENLRLRLEGEDEKNMRSKGRSQTKQERFINIIIIIKFKLKKRERIGRRWW